MTLTEEISRFTEDAYKRLPSDYIPAFRNLIERLNAKKIGVGSQEAGQSFPDFTLKNHEGKVVQASQFWEDNNLVLKFYRGGWCPYCHLELSALVRHSGEFASTNSVLFAIAPERPSFMQETKRKSGANFRFLWDENNALARQIGIAFAVDDAVKEVYLKLNLDLDVVNGEWILPIPATLVVKKGVVIYRHIDADYMLRQDPIELIEILRGMKNS